MQKRTIFIVGGIAVLVIILGLVGFFVVGPLITSASSPTPTPTPTAASSPTATAKKNPINAVLKPNAASIQSQVAQGLNISASQLQSDIKAGQTLSQIATAQKVSATQLQTIETNAVKPYLDQAVSAGNLTQQQENQYLKRLQKNPDLLDNLLKVKAA